MFKFFHPVWIYCHLIAGCFFCSPFLIGEADKKPKALFSAIFWEEFQNESFSYAPWGNETEDNATIVDISVGSSSLSRKFAYYGDGKLNLYRTEIIDDIEPGGSASKPVSPKNLAAEFHLPLSDGNEMKEYLLLFTQKKKNGLWKVYPIPFSLNEIPYGSYKFVSQSRNTLYFMFGQEKVTLQSGKSIISPAKLEDGKRGILLKVMGQENGKVIEVFSQKWGHSPRMRGIYFLGMNGNKMTVKRMIELKSQLSASAGYAVPALKTFAK